MKLKHLSCPSAALLFAAIGLLSRPAQADIMVSADPVTVTAGSTGNQFDVFLTNDGPGAITVAGFSFGISVANPFISFTAATASTALPYIFGANSDFGPDLIVSNTGQSLLASDLYAIQNAGATIGAGSTVGLGRISFDVLAGATPGMISVTFASSPGTTSLSDPGENDITIATLTSGSLTIAGTTPVPEPSGIALLFGVFLLILSSRTFRRRIRPED